MDHRLDLVAHFYIRDRRQSLCGFGCAFIHGFTLRDIGICQSLEKITGLNVQQLCNLEHFAGGYAIVSRFILLKLLERQSQLLRHFYLSQPAQQTDFSDFFTHMDINRMDHSLTI